MHLSKYKQSAIRQVFIPIAYMLTGIFVLTACGGKPENIVTAGEDTDIILTQVPGCASLFRSTEKCFDYTFNEDLEVRFCLEANCCPDSNRFALTADIDADTIRVAAIDTALNLCRCICPYEIVFKITGLTEANYHFICQYMDSVYYNEVIFR